MQVKIMLPDGKVIKRVLRLVQCGNFFMAIVRYQNWDYLLAEWEGDEYLRPEDRREYYTLGKRLE